MHYRNLRKGFTLIEILICIAIFVVLVAIGYQAYLKTTSTHAIRLKGTAPQIARDSDGNTSETDPDIYVYTSRDLVKEWQEPEPPNLDFVDLRNKTRHSFRKDSILYVKQIRELPDKKVEN